LMNLAVTVFSYWLFASRNSLLTAHQRHDIINIISIIINSSMYVTQIILLYSFKNYYYYLSATIPFQIITNIVTAIYSKKYYPDYDPAGTLPNEEKKVINKKIRDLFTAKIGGVVNHSADSIVISTFAGLKLLAIYQNYYYVTSAVMALFTIFFSSLTAGLGNYIITNDNKNKKKLLYNINYIVFFVLNFCCCSLVCLYQPFMKLWVGEDNMLPTEFVFLFALYLYAEIAPRTLIVFKDAGGIWESDRSRPLVAATVNLVLNILSFKYIGLYGIILSTVFALLFIAYPWLIININNYMFKIDVRRYLWNSLLYTIAISFSIAVTYFVCNSFLIINNYMLLVVRLILSVILPNLMFVALFYRKAENRYMLENFAKMLHLSKKGI
ncbi:MAG: polysaccharide biosynthesis protein, partial [Candidatus Riflebacteria bacterium]|nr:polysaccharide biosynthesis protein [Candidatus Riflebacteria bacterium]